MHPLPRTLAALAAAGALLLAGVAAAPWIVPDGLASYRGDPPARAAAGLALEMAWTLRDHPLQRVLTPAARVVEVRRIPGHCPTGPGSDSPYGDYVARVRFHTAFGIPAGTVYVTCGGWYASASEPEAWRSAPRTEESTMQERANVSLYFAHGDRTAEFRAALSEIQAHGGLDGCSYDCWFQEQTRHTALVLHGPCDALHTRLRQLDGWYLQPLEWKDAWASDRPDHRPTG